MYKIFIRKILFLFDAELIHKLVFAYLKIINKIPGVPSLLKKVFCVSDPRLEREVFGIKFKNPIGLAAGFDKTATHFKEMENMGFGFIEIGTVTPKAQPGNDKKRIFRLKQDCALINRMGFNNDGVLAAVERLKKNRGTIIGGNIGKNKVTPNERAKDDYLYCFEQLFPYVNYFVVNVSSPNTPNLRALQEKEPLKELLNALQEKNNHQLQSKPILLKIAPDLTDEQLLDIIEIVRETKIAGVIATNTTIGRENLESPQQTEAGGLSGKPLTKRSTEVIRFLHENSKGAFPIIGVGGIHSVEDCIEKLNAGASLLQLYTGFIYEGPMVVKKMNKELTKRL